MTVMHNDYLAQILTAAAGTLTRAFAATVDGL